MFVLKVLKSAINSIFNDFNTPDRYQKSYNLFVEMFSKSSHLHQWVGRVLEETITKDLAKAKQEFHDKYHELKEERMNLIKSKVKEKLGVELEVCINCLVRRFSFVSMFVCVFSVFVKKSICLFGNT